MTSRRLSRRLYVGMTTEIVGIAERLGQIGVDLYPLTIRDAREAVDVNLRIPGEPGLEDIRVIAGYLAARDVVDADGLRVEQGTVRSISPPTMMTLWPPRI
jgi:hypothetical protein